MAAESDNTWPPGAGECCFLYGPESGELLKTLWGSKWNTGHPGNPAGHPIPAVLPGYRRVFAGHSRSWQSSVASLAPAESAECRGSVVRLSAAELDELAQQLRDCDLHVGTSKPRSAAHGNESPTHQSAERPPDATWRRLQVEILAYQSLGNEPSITVRTQASVFVLSHNEWASLPSDEYLRACHNHTAEAWHDATTASLEVRDAHGQLRATWRPAATDLKPHGILSSSRALGRRHDQFLSTMFSAARFTQEIGVAAPSATAVSGPRLRTPVYIVVSAAEVADVNIVEQTFKVRVRLYWMWELSREERLQHADLVERAYTNHSESTLHLKLSSEEAARMASSIVVPKPVLYNQVTEELIDDMDLRIYSVGPDDAQMMANAAYSWTCRCKVELKEFPFDFQRLPLDFRFQDTTVWQRFDLVVFCVQFARRALDLEEWTVLEPSVDRKGTGQTIVQVLLRRRAQFYLLNIVSVVLALSLSSLLAFAVDYEDNAGRLGVTLTLLLTSVAFKLLIADSLPVVAYMTLLDKYLLLSLLSLVVVSIFAVAPLLVAQSTGDAALASRVNVYLCAAGASFMIVSTVAWVGVANKWLAWKERGPEPPPPIAVDEPHEWYVFDFTRLPGTFFDSSRERGRKPPGAPEDKGTGTVDSG